MDGKNQRLILKMGFSSTNTRGQSSGRVKPGGGGTPPKGRKSH